MTNQLSILNNTIRTLDGLYSLNDLHKASGENPSQRPSNFVRNEQIKDLISEIEKDQSSNLSLACKSLRGGLNAGVWACEELALAYATWISPKFHLVVLRAFIAMHKGQVQSQQTLPNKKVNIRTITYEPNPISVDERELISIIMLFHKLKPIAKDLQIIARELKQRNQYALADIADDHAYTLTKSSLISRVESTVTRFIRSCQREEDQTMYFEMLYAI